MRLTALQSYSILFLGDTATVTLNSKVDDENEKLQMGNG